MAHPAVLGISEADDYAGARIRDRRRHVLGTLPEITIASEDAYFQMPLVPGLGFPGGETMIEPWVFMNYKRAAEYLYTAQTLSAEDALRMGLVNRVVARENLEDVTEAVAANISRAPLSTLMATKTMLVRAWEQMGMRQHLQLSADVMSVLEHTSDAQALRARLAGPWPTSPGVCRRGVEVGAPQKASSVIVSLGLPTLRLSTCCRQPLTGTVGGKFAAAHLTAEGKVRGLSGRR